VSGDRVDSLQNSTIIAGYRIDGALGEGGMGTVYRATQLSLERVVALKVLTTELSSDPAFRERFRREGLLQAALDHPHIVTVYEAGETDQRLFLAMRMVKGPTLKELILRRSLGDRRALRLLTQVAEALDAAHAKGLIHRDVKPQNVLVGEGDHAYLADFGLTRGHDDTPMTATGLFVGTIDYISPEQARGERATAQSDVYALTAVLYECLTGQVPYVRASEERVLLAHLSEDPPCPSQVRSDLPAALDEVISAGMAKDPAERPTSASELMLNVRRAFGVLPAATDAAEATLRGSAGAPTAPAGSAASTDPGATRIAPAAVSFPVTEAPAPQPAATPQPAPGGVAGTPAAPGASAAQPASAAKRSGGFLLAVVAAALIAAAVGAVLGGGRGSSSHPYGNSASAGNIELSFPSTWQRTAPAQAIPGLAFSETIALAPTGAPAGERLLAGEVNARGPSLMPSGLLAELAHPPASPAAVRLGDVDAYRYSDLSVRGLPATLTLYVVPSTAGVATVACLGGSAATSAYTQECAQIAATLRLSGASAFALTASPQYAGALSRALGSLQSALAGAGSRLHSASSVSAQAAAAKEIASAFENAGVSLARLPVSPSIGGANANLASALKATGAGYGALAGAARAEDGAAYAQASRVLSRSQARIASALGELRKAGYTIGG
jgi:Protein kinase domain